MKHGFTLIEVVLALALAALVTTGLYTIYFQIQRSYITVDRVTDLDMRLALLYDRLQKDIEGMFIPYGAEPAAEKKEAAVRTNEQGPAKAHKVIPQPCFTAVKDTQLLFFTFITNNPLHVYGREQQRVVRVTYRLEQEENREGQMRLLRHETTDVHNEVKKEQTLARAYELVDGVKNFSVSFVVPKYEKQRVEEKDARGQAQSKEVKKLVAFDQTSSWDKDIATRKKEELPLLPWYVAVEGVLTDPSNTSEQPFSFLFKVYAAGPKIRQEREQPQRVQKQSTKVPSETLQGLNKVFGEIDKRSDLKQRLAQGAPAQRQQQTRTERRTVVVQEVRS